jgi:hypothetical protein
MRTQGSTSLILQNMTHASGVIPIFETLRCEMIGKFWYQRTFSRLAQGLQRLKPTPKGLVLYLFARFLRTGLHPSQNPEYCILSRCVVTIQLMTQYQLEDSMGATRPERQQHERGARRFWTSRESTILLSLKVGFICSVSSLNYIPYD